MPRVQTKSSLNNLAAPRNIDAAAWSLPLFLICFACVCVRLCFVFIVPTSQAPDEITHHFVVSFIKEHGRLLTAVDVATGGAAAVYGSLPAMGYVPHLLFSWLAPDHALFYERMASLLGGVVLVFAGFKLGQQVFPERRVLQLALPAVLVFHPQLAFVESYVNNDATASALAALIVWLTARGMRSGIDTRGSVCLGALLGWLVLSKYSGLALVPAVLMGVCASGAINGTAGWLTVKQLAMLVLTCVFASAWCFIRNAVEFHGDFLGTQTMYHAWAIAYHKPLTYHLPFWNIAFSLRWWRMMFFSFWGLFGYMDLYLWRPIYLAYLGYAVAAGLGWAMAALRNGKRAPAGASGADAPRTPAAAKKQPQLSGDRELMRSRLLWICLASVPAFNLAAMIWASTGNLGGPQGRYLFCSELPIVALLLAGLDRLGGRFGDRLVLTFVLFNAAVCLGAWIMLIRLHGIAGRL